MSATSMPDGTYRLGNLEVQVADGVASYRGTRWPCQRAHHGPGH